MATSRERSSRSRRAVLAVAAGVSLAPACSLRAEGVPEGALARVGARVFEPSELDALSGQLDGYGQLRFSQEGGQRALLMALIAAELLSQTAQDAGYASDPRVEWALIEEAAGVELLTTMERAVPYDAVAADPAALRAEYDRQRALPVPAFVVPERRSFAGVAVDSVEQGTQLLAEIEAGTRSLSDIGEIVTTREQPRDDATLPGFSPVLFTEGLSPGALLPHPVLIGTRVYIGRLESRTPAQSQDFFDEAVQEQLVNRVRSVRVEAARADYLEELRKSTRD